MQGVPGDHAQLSILCPRTLLLNTTSNVRSSSLKPGFVVCRSFISRSFRRLPWLQALPVVRADDVAVDSPPNLLLLGVACSQDAVLVIIVCARKTPMVTMNATAAFSSPSSLWVLGLLWRVLEYCMAPPSAEVLVQVRRSLAPCQEV